MSPSREHRISLLTVLLGLSLTLVATLVLTSTQTEAVSASPRTDEAHFVGLINELRHDEGLDPVQVDVALTNAARDWTAELAQDQELSHAPDLSVGVDVYWLKLGENVGVGPQGEIEAIFDAFVASPDHYANLVDPDFAFVGIGVLHDDDGRLWTTHRFMHLGVDPTTVGD